MKLLQAVWRIAIIILFLLSFIGLVVPILPAVGLVWIGIALYYLFISATAISTLTWWILVILTAVIVIADQLASGLLVHRRGGSRISIVASVIGVFLGIWLLPPFGVIVIPFLLVFAIETWQRKTPEVAAKIAFAVVLAFLSSTVARALLQLTMISVFLVDVL